MSFRVLIVVFFLASSSQMRARAEEPVCPQVLLEEAISPAFDESEKRWLCGSQDEKTYQRVPLYQARFHAKAFLQKRGHLDPSFDLREGRLVIRPGKLFRAKKISIEVDQQSQSPEEILVNYRGRVLSPGLLDSLNADLSYFYRQQGYPCPQFALNAIDEEIFVSGARGETASFDSLTIDPHPELRSEAFLRFQPFAEKQPFDIRKATLYEKRLLRREVLQNTQIRMRCKGEATELHQTLILGPPRSIRFGFGLDTDKGPFFNFRWENHRYQDMASHLLLRSSLSWREQSLGTLGKFFLWPEFPRGSFQPEFNLTHKNRENFQELRSSLDAGLYRSWDFKDNIFEAGFGPSLVLSRFTEGEEGSSEAALGVDLFLTTTLMSHRYELEDLFPEKGFTLNFYLLHASDALFNDYRSSKLSLESLLLDPYPLLEGALFYPALRWGLSLSESNAPELGDIAPSYKSYLGGYSNLRGFKLDEYPLNEGLGALSSLYYGVEIRASKRLWEKFLPYLFHDGAWMGERSLSLDSQFLWSVGLGLRWLSPIGMLQSYVSTSSERAFFWYAGLGGRF